MLNADGTPDDDDTTQRAIAQGNILFLLSNSTEMRNKADTTDEFNLMPYLSENGDQNVFILNVSRYVGLNKRLGEKDNEQQLKDAFHVMEVLSTVEGLESLAPTQASDRLLLKVYTVDKSSNYSEVLDALNIGYTEPFIYSGWENIFAPLDETMNSYGQ